LTPVSSEISDLLLFVSYFASQNKEIKFDNYFFDMYYILVRCQVPTTSYSTGITLTTENIGLSLRFNYSSFSHSNPNPNPTHLPKHETLSPNHQFSQRI